MDNNGFYRALNGKNKVIPIFIFDPNILDRLPREDARVEFILLALGAIDIAMKRNRCNVGVYHGTPEAIFNRLINQYQIEEVICNGDYEPYATKRDKKIKTFLSKKGIDFKAFKDQVIFEKSEIVKDDGNPYKVYTPYSRKWLSYFDTQYLEEYPSESLLSNCYSEQELPKIKLNQLGFTSSNINQPKHFFDNQIIDIS